MKKGFGFGGYVLWFYDNMDEWMDLLQSLKKVAKFVVNTGTGKIPGQDKLSHPVSKNSTNHVLVLAPLRGSNLMSRCSVNYEEFASQLRYL